MLVGFFAELPAVPVMWLALSAWAPVRGGKIITILAGFQTSRLAGEPARKARLVSTSDNLPHGNRHPRQDSYFATTFKLPGRAAKINSSGGIKVASLSRRCDFCFAHISGVHAMTTHAAERSNDPRHHTKNIKRMLDDLITHAREDVEKIDEPKAKVLFETTAEVLTGLKTAYDHYEAGSESAFRSR